MQHYCWKSDMKRSKRRRNDCGRQAGLLAVSSADIVDPTQDIAGALTIEEGRPEGC